MPENTVTQVRTCLVCGHRKSIGTCTAAWIRSKPQSPNGWTRASIAFCAKPAWFQNRQAKSSSTGFPVFISTAGHLQNTDREGTRKLRYLCVTGTASRGAGSLSQASQTICLYLSQWNLTLDLIGIWDFSVGSFGTLGAALIA